MKDMRNPSHGLSVWETRGPGGARNERWRAQAVSPFGWLAYRLNWTICQGDQGELHASRAAPGPELTRLKTAAESLTAQSSKTGWGEMWQIRRHANTLL